uniref:Putative exonuclease n=1 Tax=viral metagenome TaxID=1070528 RepID=A0A6M3LV33_9ZZZZ
MIILIDSNYLCYYHSFRSPLSYEGQQVGIIFGFMQSLLALSKVFDTNRFVFAWDSRRSLRRVWLPTYKESRRGEKSAEEMLKEIESFRQFAALRTEVLPQFGFQNVFLKPGYEADDIIASVCRDNPEEEIAIVSSDNDLYQCISSFHFMYDVKKKAVYHRLNFMREWGIEPEDWAKVKSIAGCPGDNVPGVDGIGNKTAIKYLKGELSEKSKAFQKIEQGKREGKVSEAQSLVELPFAGTGNFFIEKTEVFDVKDFLDICDKYGFKSFIAQLPTWQDYFGMKGRR